MSQEEAELVAAQVLGFLAAEPARLMAFCNATGFDPADIRVAAGERWFGAALLDYILRDEPLLLAFATHVGTDPAAVQHASDQLSG